MLAALIISFKGGIHITVVLKNEEPKQATHAIPPTSEDLQVTIEDLLNKNKKIETSSVDDAIEKLNEYLNGG
jgi:hypothetical protein